MPIDKYDPNTAPIFFILYTPLLAICATVMSKRHPGEVYLVWYIFFLSFLLFFALDYVTQGSIVSLCGSFETTCKVFHEEMTDPRGEILSVLVFLAAIIGPQLLTYIFSGLFGCATAPRFVPASVKIGMWSLIKFFGFLAGISFAHPLALLANHQGDPLRLGDFVSGLIAITMAFVCGLALCIGESVASWCRRSFVQNRDSFFVRSLLQTHKWFKRRRVKSKPSPYLVNVHVHLPELSRLAKLSDRVRVDTHLHAR